jgi:hypothetical protein
MNKFRVKVTLRLVVYRQSVYLGAKTLENHDQYIFLDWTLGVAVVWQEDGSVVYSCCWLSPTQSFSGPSLAGLMAIFYCLRFEIPPTWRARSKYLYSPGTGWPSHTPRHWNPFSSPPTTHRTTMEVFEPASTRGWLSSIPCVAYNLSALTT